VSKRKQINFKSVNNIPVLKSLPISQFWFFLKEWYVHEVELLKCEALLEFKYL